MGEGIDIQGESEGNDRVEREGVEGDVWGVQLSYGGDIEERGFKLE